MSQQHAHTRDGELADINQQGPAPEEKKPEADDGIDWLGNFMITHYTIALEADPMYAGTPKISAPGLNPEEKYREGFLGANGVKMEGSGRAENGKEIHYEGNGHYGYGIAGARGTPRDWKTCAVDPSVIPYHSQVVIEKYKDKGAFDANDTGGAIKGQHIDVFAGAISNHAANVLGTLNSRVGIVGKGKKAPQAAPAAAGGGEQKKEHAPEAAHEGGGPQKKPAGPVAGGDTKPPQQQLIHYTPAPSVEDVKAGKAVIKKGHFGPAVKMIQAILGSPDDGFFGSITDGALVLWQSSKGLEVDGVIGMKTIHKLLGLNPPGQDAAKTAHASPGGDPGEHKAPPKPQGHDAGVEAPAPNKDAAAQMSMLLSIARGRAGDQRPGGWCYAAVKEYIGASKLGYGNIHNVFTDPRFAGKQGYAHDFADAVNSGPSKFGLENLGSSSPYAAPAGSIVVVAAGSPGTHHPTAGDITVAGGGGTFYNDGNMGYGGEKAWPPARGGVLGVFKPV